MAALPDLITVEQYRRLPDDGVHCYELQQGEVIEVSRPKAGHFELQERLVDVLRPKLSGFGRVSMELPYRAIPEFDLRAADVAAVTWARWRSIDPDDNLRGAPELMIEVISPSNTPSKLRQMVSLCLTNGSVECWLIDRQKQSITVICKDGLTTVYRPGNEIPLTAFGSDSLPVATIFE
jgi:Uma2 family endonuclease